MFAILVSVASLAFVLYLYLTWNFGYWRKRGVTGPTPRVYVGTFPKTALLDRSSNYILETTEIYREYYREHRFIGTFEYRTPKLLILDPSLVTDIFVKYFKNFSENTVCDWISSERDHLFECNPFVEKFEQWRVRRQELSPGYSASKAKSSFPSVEISCRQMIQYIKNHIQDGCTTFGSKDISRRVVGAAVCMSLFGMDVKAFEDPSEFVEISGNLFYSGILNNFRDIFYLIFPWLRYLYPQRFTSTEFTKWFCDLLDSAIQIRQKSNISRDDHLNFLIDLKNKKNPPEKLFQAQAFTLFLDGFETTSYALGSAINFLAQNKDCQDKLRDEIRNHKNADFDELHQLPYLDAVIHEAIRLCPFPFVIWKNCTESIELEDYDGSTVLIERGVQIVLPLNALHTHPDFYDEPEKFNPERFMESSDVIKRLKDAGVFVAFGNGPRQCLGMRFAIAQLKATLYALVGNFEFSIKNAESGLHPPMGIIFFSENLALLEMKLL